MYTRKRIFEIIQVGSDGDRESRIFDYLLVAAIIVNLFIALFSTFEASAEYEKALYSIELVTVIFFTMEFALRVWTADYLFHEKNGRYRSAMKFFLSPSGLVDFLAFFPFYLPHLMPFGVVAFRIFRVIRIFKLFRVTSYQDSLNVITDVVKKRKNQLISSVFLVLILMISASILMYGIEHEAQPDVFRNAFSGFWWATSTLLTVGYGDIYPITTLGKVIGIILTFLGVGMVAVPTGILSAGFIEHLNEIEDPKKKEGTEYCPRCGNKIR
jgi:voltage-gated potassium channel